MTELMPPKNYARIPVGLELPQLIEVQLESFERLKTEGLANLFNEVSPIVSYGGDLRLHFPSDAPLAREFDLQFWFEEPKNTIEECLERDLTYARPLYVSVLLEGAEQTEAIKQDLFLGDFPEMTNKGTFIINGTERVVVSQLIRSPGVYFEADQDRATGRMMSTAKLIPDRGAWMEFETRKNDFIILKFNRKRTVPITVFLRALSTLDDGIADSPLKTGSDEEIMALFADVDNNPEHPYIENSFAQEPEYDPNKDIAKEALLEFYRRLRPGEPPIVENAENYLKEQLFDPRHYDLELVGRYKLNQKLDLYDVIPGSHRMITKHDIVRIIRHMIQVNNGKIPKDDIDHLGNRRVKTVGELIQNKLRVGLRRMERVIKERMSIRDAGSSVAPASLVNIRPLVASLREFFGSSQLSQFMEETNPLSELRHKRTISALGPGGLRRERAGFDVRDVHFSHYGRICPIETPEGPNIGLIGRLAAYAQVNEFGFIETPYRKVYQNMKGDDPNLAGHLLRQNIVDPETGEIVYETETRIDKKMAKKIKELGIEVVDVRPFVSDDYEYLSADAEDKYVIAQANAPLNEYGEFLHRNSCRYANQFAIFNYEDIDYIDVAPNQVVGISAALIPFLEHDDANRALMGSNMQRQAVPLLQSESPYVATGNEARVARDSGVLITAEEAGIVAYVSAAKIIVSKSGKVPTKSTPANEYRIYTLRKFMRSNAGTCFNQKPVVRVGQQVKKGEVLADGPAMRDGELALGKNVLVAFLPCGGYNFEDAILINEQLVADDTFTSIHIEEFECSARDTKLGPEEITRDIPNVGEEALKNLTHGGVVRIGAEVKPGDILVGKITPKTETELAPEERLLRAIFGEKAAEVRDTSLRVPSGTYGIVMGVRMDSHGDEKTAKRSRLSAKERRQQLRVIQEEYRQKQQQLMEDLTNALANNLLGEKIPLDVVNVETGEKIIPANRKITKTLLKKLAAAREHIEIDASPIQMKIESILSDYNHRFAELANEEVEARARLESGEDVEPGIIKQVKVYVASKKKLAVGDKMAGRHGNKGVIARIVAEEDMPFLPDGTAVGIVLNPLGVPSRMNVGQVLETHLGMACKALGLYASTPIFDGISEERIRELLKESQWPEDGKTVLFDGRSGEPFDQRVVVGVIYMMKLHHLVSDKIHARAVGPYSLVTQQPLGGKAQYGGQRFGEMEVWAMEAYGAAYALQELLTVKSDDITGRTRIYESIVKGENTLEPGVPESFNVLMKEMQSLALDVRLYRAGE